jgi:chromosomal replication initiator protein DnaA
LAQRSLSTASTKLSEGARITSEAIPEGTVISSISGGPDSLERLIEKLRKFEFTGYIMTKLRRGEGMFHGFLVIENGTVAAAIYGRVLNDKFASSNLGEDGLKQIWGDSYDKECLLETHSRLDIGAIMRQFATAAVGKAPERKVPKRRTRFSLEWGGDEKDKASEDIDLPPELRAMLDSWTAAGYVVKTLLDEVSADRNAALQSFDRFAENVKKAEFLRAEIEAVDKSRYGEDVERIRALLRNPAKITAIEAKVQGLRVKMAHDRQEAERAATAKAPEEAPVASGASKAEAGRMKGTAGEHEPRLEGHGDIFPPKQAAAEACGICGADMKGRDSCPACGGKGAESGPEPTDECGLMKAYTFDNFIIGKCNSFSHAAAVAASKPGSSYNNPMIICGPPGLGKTHLLHAAGNAAVANMPDLKVLCVTADAWAAEHEEAARTKGLQKFRAKYQGLDLFLMDDVNRLSGMPEAVRDELLRIAEALNGKRKHMLFTCERQANKADPMEDSLIARFPANLVTAVGKPDIQTRHDILRKKAAALHQPVPDSVLELIARRYTRNVRALEGALNKVAAYSKLLSAPMTLESAVEALKGDPPDPPDEPEQEMGVAISSMERKLEILKISHSYLIEEERPVKCFEYFVDNLNIGMKGLALTRINPKRIKEQYNIGESSVLWLTDREGDPEGRVPPALERIIYKIEDFLNMPGKSILLIDGLDYLISNNNFDAVLRFLRRLIDEVSESDAIFIMSITPQTIDEQGLRTLEREMEIISYLDSPVTPP